jgi:CPW-WPC domain-containing protein
MSAYIGKGTRLTIHTNIIEHRSESNITIFVKSGEIPTQRNNDFKLSGRDPGFSQFSCYGVMLYWQIQLDQSIVSRRNKVNIGITLTVDECIQKNYEQACPTKWLATSGGWCQPPEEYKGPCRSQNYFGTQRVANGFSVPSSWEYKMLWSERCGADWPCDVFVSSKCALLLHNLYQGKWKKLNHKKEISDFGSFQLLPADRKKNVYLFFVDIPPGSSVLIKVIPTLEALLTKFKEASTTVSGKSDLMMSGLIQELIF